MSDPDKEKTMASPNFFDELERRNVIRAAAFLPIQSKPIR
jgi:hypothetical protein